MTEETQGAADAVTDDTVLPVETEGQDTQPGDNAAAEAAEGEAEQPKPKKSAQDRIDELTRARREAERDAEYWKGKALQAEPKPEAEAPKGDGRPDPNGYEYGAADERYIEDLTDWKATQAVERTLSARDQHQQARSAVQTFEQRLKEQFPEGEPEGVAAIRRMPKLDAAIQEVILTSEIGPKLADHLGANPNELARLSALPPALQGRELGKLEARLETPAAPKPKTATDAPEPTPQVRGAGGRFTVAGDTTDFAAFEAQHMGKK